MSAPASEFADVDHITFANLERHDRLPRVCPDWRKENISSVGLYRLTNNVHPAFDASRFIGRRFSLEDTQQARLFASRLLEAECSIPFWWALMIDRVGRDKDSEEREAKAANIRLFPSGGAAVPQSEIYNVFLRIQQARTPDYELCLEDPPPSEWRPEPLTNRQIAEARAILRDLARNIHYEVGDDADGSRCMTAWTARAASPFRGSPSAIVINAEELRMHSRAMEGDLICQVWASVSLGFKLVQLLAHAAVSAARSGAECNWNNRYRFAADPKRGAEVRMLESCTFGGVLRREQEQEQVAKSHYTINGVEGVPGLWFAFSDFPGEHIFAMAGSLPDGHSFFDPSPGEDGPNYHREWKVSFSWLLRLLTDTFWNNDVRTRGQAALTPPKEVGYVMHRDSKRKYGPLHAGMIRRGIVAHGYRMLPRSCVMVKKRLYHNGGGHIMFGGFDIGRLELEDDADLYRDDDSRSEGDESESSESGMADDTSDNDGDNDGDDDGDVDDFKSEGNGSGSSGSGMADDAPDNDSDIGGGSDMDIDSD